MRLELYTEARESIQSKYFEILNFDKISDNTDLLLVINSEMHFSNKKPEVNDKNNFYSIYKIQFIAICDIEISKNLVVAFYVNADGELTPFIISELPNHYFYNSIFYLIDYQGYIDICKITKERVLPFSEYLELKKIGSVDPNSFLKYDDNYFNSDEAGDVYDKIAGVIN